MSERHGGIGDREGLTVRTAAGKRVRSRECEGHKRHKGRKDRQDPHGEGQSDVGGCRGMVNSGAAIQLAAVGPNLEKRRWSGTRQNTARSDRFIPHLF